mmetsp:Transcript_69717/g.113129  ORF Transcript_69717/g.113129 Transcript_69717/m.113129 type:complete len:95 (+) Transcript_69717:986-1270(+)
MCIKSTHMCPVLFAFWLDMKSVTASYLPTEMSDRVVYRGGGGHAERDPHTFKVVELLAMLSSPLSGTWGEARHTKRPKKKRLVGVVLTFPQLLN